MLRFEEIMTKFLIIIVIGTHTLVATLANQPGVAHAVKTGRTPHAEGGYDRLSLPDYNFSKGTAPRLRSPNTKFRK